ncbi:MAG TPA: YdcF family protein, partial [Rhodospirillaceae bacterium]|nr:YdcF family protein [Rhodospirillaceae bacterium]
MRRALWTALLLAALWLAGYLAFFAGVLAQSRAPLTQGAGAIVVLTGAPGRVDMGISLLRVRLAPRLF